MNERNQPEPESAERTVGEEVDEQTAVLGDAFNLSPETAGAAAADLVSDRMRKPASDDVETARIAEANAVQNKGEAKR